MEQYERLWQYQQVDMELDQYEKEMRGNSNRKELLKHRDFLLEQQNVLKKIETDVEVMSAPHKEDFVRAWNCFRLVTGVDGVGIVPKENRRVCPVRVSRP